MTQVDARINDETASSETANMDEAKKNEEPAKDEAEKVPENLNGNTSDAVAIEDFTFICGECGFSFEGPENLQRHIDLKRCNDSIASHLKTIFQCKFCSLTFKKEEDLNGHKELTHTVYCYKCNFVANKVEDLEHQSELTTQMDIAKLEDNL